MHSIATLGDAPIAAIAVVAMLLGLFFVARGPRDRRQTGGEEPAGPTQLSSVPVSTPEVESGFVGPEGEIVGHGPIRLGQVSPLDESRAAPAADVPTRAAAPADVPAPAPPRPNPFRQGTIKLGGKPAGKPPTD